MKRWVTAELQSTTLSKEERGVLKSAAEKADKTKREKGYIFDIYALVSKDDKCTATQSQFDQDLHLLGTPGKTIDLKNLKGVDPDPNDFISK